MRGWRSFAVAAGCAAGMTLLQARDQQPSTPAPQFRTGIELVRVDVSALDRSRRPIRGLTASDFSVAEEGVPQTIASVAEITVPDPPEVPAAWMREVAPDVSTNVAGADRLIVMVLDDAQILPSPRLTAAVKQVGRKVIDGLGPADLAAVVFTGNNSGAQPFTSNRWSLLQAVDAFSGGHHTSGGGRDPSIEYFTRASLDTLANVAEHLANAPEQRKLVVYVSPGFHIDHGQGFRTNDLQRIILNARRANVTIYAIDPRGLEVVDIPAPSAPVDPVLVSSPASFLRTLAIETGGAAIIDRNDFVEGVAQMFRENGSYYVIGYQSSNAGREGRFVQIDVRVKHPDAIVRARTAYRPPRQPPPAKASGPPAELARAIGTVTPERGVPMVFTASPFAIPGKKESAVAVVVALPQRPLGGPRTVRHDVLLGAYGPEGGRPVASQRLTANVTLEPGIDEAISHELLGRLDLKPGRYQFRAAAIAGDESGSLQFDLEVPDFAKAPLSLSGILVGAPPAQVAAAKDVWAGLLPIVPTARRDFRTSQRPTTLVRVYQARDKMPAAVTIRMQVMAGNAVAVERTDTLAADAFAATRAADYVVDLPIERLSPGPHLLTLEAVAGRHAVKRHLRFTVH